MSTVPDDVVMSWLSLRPSLCTMPRYVCLTAADALYESERVTRPRGTRPPRIFEQAGDLGALTCVGTSSSWAGAEAGARLSPIRSGVVEVRGAWASESVEGPQRAGLLRDHEDRAQLGPACAGAGGPMRRA